MPFVVSRLCIDCVDTACVAVCPVDCFFQPRVVTADYPNMLYISAEECIDCGVCEPECPWEAIYPEEDLPAALADSLQLNTECDRNRDAFRLAVVNPHRRPTPEAVVTNKEKWGL